MPEDHKKQIEQQLWNIDNTYLSSIIQKGAKNTIIVTSTTFLSKRLLLPVSKIGQKKIVESLKAIDKKTALTVQQIEKSKTYKKGCCNKCL